MKGVIQGVVLVGAMALLAGCAVQPKKPDTPLSEVHPTPVCVGDDQCSRMWGRAIEGASLVTQMKVMSASDTFIQTYPTRQIGYLNGQVYKEKLGENRYAIRGSFGCNPYDWCNHFRNTTQDAFNRFVQGSDPVSD